MIKKHCAVYDTHKYANNTKTKTQKYLRHNDTNLALEAVQDIWLSRRKPPSSLSTLWRSIAQSAVVAPLRTASKRKKLKTKECKPAAETGRRPYTNRPMCCVTDLYFCDIVFYVEASCTVFQYLIPFGSMASTSNH